MFIFDSNRFARERAALPAEVEEMIKANGGEVLVSRLWEERRLAYPIAGQRKGTYWLIYFRRPELGDHAAQSAMGNPRRHPAAAGAEDSPAPGRSGARARQGGPGAAAAPCRSARRPRRVDVIEVPELDELDDRRVVAGRLLAPRFA